MKAIELKLAAHPFFCSMRPDHLGIVVENARSVEFAEGEILFGEGEPANRFFLIQSGRIALDTRCRTECEAQIQVLGVDDILGWSWLFPPFSWHFRAKALEPTRAILFDGGHLLVAAEANPVFGYDLMKRVARIVISRLQQYQSK